MATRMIGTDTLDPRLPDSVITASIGTTADTFAAGDAPVAAVHALANAVDVNWFGNTLADFNAALSEAVGAGRSRVLVIPGPGIYDFDDNWIIRESNVEIILMPGATLRMTGESTLGGLVAIAEGAAFGGSDSDQVENVYFHGGGTVITVEETENAVSLVRAKDCTIEGLNVYGGRYGITGQVNIDRCNILRNVVHEAHAAGIDISDTTTITNHDNLIEGNRVISSTAVGSLVGKGIRVTCFDGMTLRDNVVVYAQGRAFEILGTSGAHSKRLHASGNTVLDTDSLILDMQWVDQASGDIVAGVGGSVNLANCADHDISMAIDSAPSTSSLTLNTLTGRSKVRAKITNQVSTTGALSITSPPAAPGWEVQIGAGAHNRICANAVALLLSGSAEGGSSEPFFTGCSLLPNSTIAINGGRHRQAITYAASLTPVFWTTSTFAVTLTGNTTINNMSTVTPAKVPGHRITFDFTQDAAGGRTVAWGTTYKVGAWTPDTAASKRNMITFESDGTNWVQVASATGI